jgi:hypothetical protein
MLGWKKTTGASRSNVEGIFGDAFAPNLADVGGPSSLRISGHCRPILPRLLATPRRSAGNTMLPGERTSPVGIDKQRKDLPLLRRDAQVL